MNPYTPETNYRGSAYLFVYGTLQRGLHNHSVMEDAFGEFVGEATTINRYPLTVDSLPYLHNHQGVGHRVEGELYKIGSISRIDFLEGHPHFYERKLIEVESDDILVCRSWAYFIKNGHRESPYDFKPEEMHKSYRKTLNERSFIKQLTTNI